MLVSGSVDPKPGLGPGWEGLDEAARCWGRLSDVVPAVGSLNSKEGS